MSHEGLRQLISPQRFISFRVGLQLFKAWLCVVRIWCFPLLIIPNLDWQIK
jgi:hypothetical protein